MKLELELDLELELELELDMELDLELGLNPDSILSPDPVNLSVKLKKGPGHFGHFKQAETL